MKEYTCCFTGHRRLPTEKIPNILMNLNCEIDKLILKGVTDFISGGALGFDQMAASTVVVKRELGEHIRLIFALPCKNQDALWDEKQKHAYKHLLDNADEIIYVSQDYDPNCMRRRNQYMTDRSSCCICALWYERSGTGQTVRFAQKKGLHVFNVAL